MSFAIQIPAGLVSGYNSAHMIVQVTRQNENVKVFATEKKAFAFIEKYADAGFGLSRADSKVVPFNK